MGRQQNSSFAVAAGVSLAVHAAIFVALPKYFGGGTTAVAAREPEVLEVGVLLEPPPPLPDPPPPEPEDPDEFKMGAPTGKGFASHEVGGPTDATAPEADSDQAFLSLDPAGTGDSGSDATASQAKGEGSTRGQPGGTPPPPPVPESEFWPTHRSPAPFGLVADARLPKLPQKLPPEPLISTPTDPPPAKIEVAAAEPEQVVEAPPNLVLPPPVPPQPDAVAVSTPPQPQVAPITSPATGSPTTGGTQQPAADPARMSDSESDPFSRLGTVTFSDGALQIRFGRKVKTRKPKLLLGGQVDLLTLQRAKVVLGIDIDATGSVTAVDIVRSSGSNAIDQPTRLAVYDWWFEPKKASDGHPVADRVQFTIAWR